MEEKNINVNVEENTNNVDNEKKVKKSNKKRKKKSFFGTILNILSFLVLIVVIIATYIGFTGFNDLKNDKVPKYYIDKTVTENNGTTITSYNFGLYRAEKHEDNKKYSYRLVPFFIK